VAIKIHQALVLQFATSFFSYPCCHAVCRIYITEFWESFVKIVIDKIKIYINIPKIEYLKMD
jgi:hypothetical protein